MVVSLSNWFHQLEVGRPWGWGMGEEEAGTQTRETFLTSGWKNIHCGSFRSSTNGVMKMLMPRKYPNNTWICPCVLSFSNWSVRTIFRQYVDFLFLHSSLIRKHNLLNMKEYFYKKCLPFVQNRGFKYYNGHSKDICSTLILLPKRGPHLATAENQNTGI